MARFSKAQREQKIEQAKQMFCKGFDFQTIADIMSDVEPVTIEKWAREFNFEKEKRNQIIAIAEIRNAILTSFADVLDDKKPKITPDQAAKYAAAFEKFSDKKKVLMYMHEAFEMLCEEYMKAIQAAKSRKEKETLLSEVRGSRSFMDKVLTRLTNEVLGND